MLKDAVKVLKLAEDDGEGVKLFLRRATAPLVSVLTREKVRFAPYSGVRTYGIFRITVS